GRAEPSSCAGSPSRRVCALPRELLRGCRALRRPRDARGVRSPWHVALPGMAARHRPAERARPEGLSRLRPQRQEPSIPAALGAALGVRGIGARRRGGFGRGAMMRRPTAVLVFDLLLALARPASAPAAEHQPWQRAPAEAQAKTNPFERDSDAARA